MNQWKIDDSLFYPLGLFNISSEEKTIFIAWCYDSLITQIFKKVEGSNVLTDQFYIKIVDTIKLITLTEYNTLVLLQNGELKYFSSFKNIKDLSFVTNVRYLSSCENDFVLIRVAKNDDSTKSILLEHYKDFKSSELIEEPIKFDITYDEVNIFDCEWEQDTFIVKMFHINEHNKEFFELISKCSITTDIIYIFSVNGNIFSLLNDTDEDNDHKITPILTVASDVTNFEYIEKDNILLIFLSCGTIEILFKSKLFKLLDRKKYYLGSEVIASTFSNESYFYSDPQRIIKVDFEYDNQNHTLNILEEDQFIPGIVALTWVKTIGKLVCVSENNIFYRAKFSSKSKKTTIPTSKDLYELTPEKFQNFEKNKQLVISLLEEPKHLNKLIEEEINKQTIISIANQKDMYTKLISCRIEFHLSLSSENLTGNIIYPTEKIEYNCDSFFAIIKLDIQPNEIFIKTNWNILIYYDQNMKSIKLTKNFTNDLITIILHLKKTVLIIPKFKMELNTVVECDNDMNYISIPIEISKQNITNLFQHGINIINFNVTKSFEEHFKEILKKNFIDFVPNELTEFTYSKKTPIILTCSEICKWFNYKTSDEIDLKDEVKINVYFFGIKIIIEYIDKENLLKITTENPVALYFCKVLIAEKLSSDFYEDAIKIDLKEELRLLLTLQAELQNNEVKNLNQLKKIHSTLQTKSNL